MTSGWKSDVWLETKSTKSNLIFLMNIFSTIDDIGKGPKEAIPITIDDMAFPFLHSENIIGICGIWEWVVVG